ncbi:MAG: CPBP family intramembrane glutamic endopeptidase [Anaerolineales bacterium]
MNASLILTIAEWLGVVAVAMLAGISPRLKRPPIGFKYPRREGYVALSLFILVLVLNYMIYSGSIGLQVKTAPSDNPLTPLWTRLMVAALSLLPCLAALWVRRQPLRSAGWRRDLAGPAGRLALALMVLTVFLRGKFPALLNGISQSEGSALLLWLGTALCEETLVRGYIQMRLNSWLGSRLGLVISALFWMVWQIPRLIGDSSALFLTLFLVFVQGLVLGWVMLKSQHVIAPALYRAVSEWLTVIQ